MTTSAAARVAAMMAMVMVMIVEAANTNNVYQPCADTRIERWDGFSFGIAFSSRDSFFYNQNQSHQLSPCDRRLSLASSNSQLALFRPKVDEISLLTIKPPLSNRYSTLLYLLSSTMLNICVCYVPSLDLRKCQNRNYS
ncbi:hypothetical protein M0R45_015906 [Rubus argutus]|uniref:Uncharacterized protein n=1 Tax=Rubus argutus TaxID=59490 RepID=A0AAW1XR14_RUBAR